MFGTDGSSTEDFRSVIDDLTVANKKLKQKLRKYERVHDAHEEDKLFEVRFHGLPEHKKKELAETLRKFAAELDDGATTDYPDITSYAPTLEQQKTMSSTSQFAESGYASMSASGQNSSTPTNQTSNQTDNPRTSTRSVYNRQQRSIQSYLHDIPAGFNPHSNVPMSDKSKKKLVVRRLEQIFAGKQSLPGSHPQPMQQEEVAQSAATADRQEREATGQHRRLEGLRVARLMSKEVSQEDASSDGEALQKFRPNLHIEEQDFAGGHSPDQRPTRPLDLDLHRAQVPVENMDYIRHLGFTPPDMDSGDAPQEGHGWMYLNLLINMAQLHTLNVTPDFVKDALIDYSSHLELSRDGRKIRWKGGLDVTKNSGGSSSEHDSSNSPYDHGFPSNRLRTSNTGTSDEARAHPEQRARQLARAKRVEEMNRFAYRPLFYRKESSEEDGESYDLSPESLNTSLQQPQHKGNSSGIDNSAVQSGSSRMRRDDGPMIFYTKAKFCTDLSGDRLGAAFIAPGAYKTITSHPLGARSYSSTGSHRASGLTESRGPMEATSMDIDSNESSRKSSSEDDLGFSPETLRDDTTGSDSPADLMDFEVSGLGGVQPEDNFSIRVRRSQTQTTPSGPSGRRQSSLYPPKILRVLTEVSSPMANSYLPTSPQRVIREEMLSASRKTLPNSTLPPASFLPFDSTSSGDVDSDLDSDESSEDESELGDGPATALPAPTGYRFDPSEDDSEEESDYSEDSDDGSVDFLATARQLDPNTIRTQEREYDAALADRLAEEIVAGSSAATGGVGSGFNSPSGEGGQTKMESTTGEGSSARGQLKRSRTDESVGLAKSKSLKTGE
jgi:hypothetical protein